MATVLPAKAGGYRLDRPWIIVPAAVALGIAIGFATTVTPKVSVGLAALLLLVVTIVPRPEYGIYAMAAFLPFEQVTALTSSVSAVKLIGVIILIGWLKRLYETRRTFFDFAARANLALLMFVAASALSLIQAQSFSSGFARLTTMLLLIALYFVIGDLAADPRVFRRTLLVLVTSASLAALWPISQFLLKGGRATGVYLEPSTSAVNLLVLVPLAAALLTLSFSRWKRLFYWSALFLFVAGVVSTLSRGPLIALFVILLLLTANKLTDRRLRGLLAVFILVTLVSLPFLKMVDPRMSLSGIEATGAAGRYELWYTAQQIFSDHWLLGIGLSGFPQAYLAYASRIPWIAPQHIGAWVAHNIFIEIAVETGILGLIAFAAFIFLTLRDQFKTTLIFIKDGRAEEAIFTSATFISFTGFLIASLALSTFYLKIFWVLLGLQAGARNRLRHG